MTPAYDCLTLICTVVQFAAANGDGSQAPVLPLFERQGLSHMPSIPQQLGAPPSLAGDCFVEVLQCTSVHLDGAAAVLATPGDFMPQQ